MFNNDNVLIEITIQFKVVLNSYVILSYDEFPAFCSFMIIFTFDDFECAEELLGEYETGKTVGEG